MAVRKVAKTVLAAALGINRGTLDNKLEGRSKFSAAEMFFIQQKFFPDVPENELFSYSSSERADYKKWLKEQKFKETEWFHV